MEEFVDLSPLSYPGRSERPAELSVVVPLLLGLGVPFPCTLCLAVALVVAPTISGSGP